MKTIILLTRSRALLWNFYRTNSLGFRRSAVRVCQADIWVGDESPQEVLTCVGFAPPAPQLITSGWLELLGPWTWLQTFRAELRSRVKVEVAVLGSRP